ncbi:unnamed protein product [Durusdinium trenchii]|uniref:Nbr1 FW domain-containing protein n=1 Tax=Durusdinium trenchii TaxID=1381693 RepID=A0ABP0QCK0_9DINO
MLSSKHIGAEESLHQPGSVIHWVLVNDGTVQWPHGTTLRLVSGPVLATPIMEVPSAAPGQTLEVDLELDVKAEGHAAYALVTPCGQPFGEILQFHVEKKDEVEISSCVILKAPESCMEGLQGEVKTLQWTLANMSNVSWPADACCQLFYNTPGFAKLPSDIDIPQEVPGGLTVEMEVPVLLPEQSGHFKAMWAIFSPSVPTFGEILIAEFEVSDFLFMEWMLVADEVESFASSETQSETQSSPTPCSPRPISAEHLMHQHIFVGNQEVVYPEEMERNGFVSLGKISGAGSWILQMILRNDGTMAWEDCALTCCFGSGFGCSRLGNVEAEPGEAVQLCVELTVETPGTSAWVLSFGGMCFGPVFIAEVV